MFNFAKLSADSILHIPSAAYFYSKISENLSQGQSPILILITLLQQSLEIYMSI